MAQKNKDTNYSEKERHNHEEAPMKNERKKKKGKRIATDSKGTQKENRLYNKHFVSFVLVLWPEPIRVFFPYQNVSTSEKLYVQQFN